MLCARCWSGCHFDSGADSASASSSSSSSSSEVPLPMSPQRSEEPVDSVDFQAMHWIKQRWQVNLVPYIYIYYTYIYYTYIYIYLYIYIYIITHTHIYISDLHLFECVCVCMPFLSFVSPSESRRNDPQCRRVTAFESFKLKLRTRLWLLRLFREALLQVAPSSWLFIRGCWHCFSVIPNRSLRKHSMRRVRGFAWQHGQECLGKENQPRKVVTCLSDLSACENRERYIDR